MDTANGALSSQCGSQALAACASARLAAACSTMPTAMTAAAASDPGVCVQRATQLADAVLELANGVLYMACGNADPASCARNKLAAVSGAVPAAATVSAASDPDACVRRVTALAADAQDLANGVIYTNRR